MTLHSRAHYTDGAQWSVVYRERTVMLFSRDCPGLDTGSCWAPAFLGQPVKGAVTGVCFEAAVVPRKHAACLGSLIVS